jgi:pyruvate/2-oxoglutarate dehydrogenase complex dihydrolipoamide dehydrogenase (E3) component
MKRTGWTELVNRGCIPSGLLIHSADVVETIKREHGDALLISIDKIERLLIKVRNYDTRLLFSLLKLYNKITV